MELKQVIAVRQDLKLPKGKTAAQAAHASVEAVFRADKKNVLDWRRAGMKKIVIKIPDEKTVYLLKKKAEESGVVCAIITDAGKTVVAPGTVTCIALGPDDEKKIDEISSSFPLM